LPHRVGFGNDLPTTGHVAKGRDEGPGSNPGEKRENFPAVTVRSETADGGVERLAALDLVHIGLGEAYIVQASLDHTRSSTSDRARVAFYPDHLPRRTNQSGHQHCYVSNAGAQIQDTLAWPNACFAE